MGRMSLIQVATREATIADAALLATMNKHLFEDAESPNPMSTEELSARLATWIADEAWRVVVFLREAAPIGYAVFSLRPDLYDPETAFVYVRQFYIDRPWRGTGYGTAAYRALEADYFPPLRKVTLDVFPHNTRAIHFWASLGFATYTMTLMARESP